MEGKLAKLFFIAFRFHKANFYTNALISSPVFIIVHKHLGEKTYQQEMPII